MLPTVLAYQMLDALQHMSSKNINQVLANCQNLEQVEEAAGAFS